MLTIFSISHSIPILVSDLPQTENPRSNHEKETNLKILLP